MKALFLAVVVLASSSVYAHEKNLSHNCQQPKRPAQFSSKQAETIFESSFAKYKQCIKTFIESQRDASENHIQAGLKAAQEWLDFSKSQPDYKRPDFNSNDPQARRYSLELKPYNK